MCRHDIRGINHDIHHDNSIQHLSINQLMEEINSFLTSSTGENRNRSLVIRYHLPNFTNRLNPSIQKILLVITFKIKNFY